MATALSIEPAAVQQDEPVAAARKLVLLLASNAAKTSVGTKSAKNMLAGPCPESPASV